MKRLIKRTFQLSVVILALLVISNIAVYYNARKFIYNDLNKIPKNEFGLVLGCAKLGKYGINSYFKHRMEAAIELYQHGKIKKIIVSGDNSRIGYNETGDMKNYLVESGIPAKDIIEDFAGFRTLDSVLRSKHVFKCTAITIISQKFHNERAVYIAQQNDLKVYAYNAKTPRSHTKLAQIREILARLLMFSDIHLFKTNAKFY
ncbi:SanA/YdcF family protein [Crocinitomix catalasitica]|uniref:SanA/YdcF family protein n=1 Tax=Crocinitomix catalasitica TaxID=184607 RepID=UPI000488EFA8|nr:ElyC/SanA/YdcF family protein [Crocinitomix catalasitica]